MHRLRISAVICVGAVALAFGGCTGDPGPKGDSCTVANNNDGTYTISCTDGTSVKVADGAAGTAGTNGTNGTNGMDGASCTVVDNMDGTKTISCTDGTTVTVTDGTNGVDANVYTDFSLLSDEELAKDDFTVTVLSVSNDAKPVVVWEVKNSKGKGVVGIPPGNFSGLAILQLVPGNTASGGNGLNLDTWVSQISNCGTCRSSTETASATSLTDNGDGTYTYTFSKDIQNNTTLSDGGVVVPGVAFDANAPHKFGLRFARSGNPFRPVDAVYEYIPATGADVTGQNDKVNTDNCLTCHQQWRANANNAGGTTPFHSGQRYEAQYCVVCHNDQRKYSGTSVNGNAVTAEPTIDGTGNMTPASGSSVGVIRGEAVINLPVWIHKIHMGEELYLKGPYAGLGAEINEIAFPQSPANCTTCHANAAMADNWKNKPNRRACGACHDNIDWVAGTNHAGGAQANDNLCAGCHPATGPITTVSAPVVTAHIPLVPTDPNNTWSGGTNSRTNAATLGLRSNPPDGGIIIDYVMPTNAVTTADDGSGNSTSNVLVKFKLKANGTDVVFNSYDGGTFEMMDDFFGAPTVYCAYAMPQDGLQAPADFNATASVYTRTEWLNGRLAGPDSSGYYTATVPARIRSTATMLTCGLGYEYNIGSAYPGGAPPLVQTNLPEFPVDGTSKVGGLSIPSANVWQVAQGYTGRRGATNPTATNANPTTGRIVNADKCNACHKQLGVGPTFHSGQRNDGPSCSFCHTQNRTSSGWSAGAGSFVHAIHGAGKRTVDFNWHALSATSGFFDVTFPGRPQQCEGCHNPGYYDFSSSWYQATNSVDNVPNFQSRLYQTVGQGTYTGSVSLSPYVATGTNYNSGYSYSSTTGAITEAATTTLVNSPITNNCSGCHDSTMALEHMRSNGGSFYVDRATAQGRTEQCLVCHGPGKIAYIQDVHYH